MHELADKVGEFLNEASTADRSACLAAAAQFIDDVYPPRDTQRPAAELIETLLAGGEVDYLDEADRPSRVSLPRLPALWRGESVSAFQSVIPPELDFLADTHGVWTRTKLAIFVVLRALVPQRRFAIVATMRNEGAALPEWLAFHRAIGFEHVFIYTNDNSDGSMDLMRALADAGEISLIENLIAPTASPQHKTYEHSIFLLPELRQFEWVSWLDADEFFNLYGVPGRRLGGLFDKLAETGRETSSYFFNWKWFGSSDVYGRSDAFVLETYRHCRGDKHGKSLSRMRDVVSMQNVHYPTLAGDRGIVDSALQPMAREPKYIDEPVYGLGQVNHYWSKSFEDFLLKKYRGLASRGLAGAQRSFTDFFNWNLERDRLCEEAFDDAFLSEVRAQHDRILALPGIAERLSEVRANVARKLGEIEQELDVARLFETRGEVALPPGAAAPVGAAAAAG